MYYPMRSVGTRRYKLIQNINYKMPFSIDQDFFISHTFQDLLNRLVFFVMFCKGKVSGGHYACQETFWWLQLSLHPTKKLCLVRSSSAPAVCSLIPIVAPFRTMNRQPTHWYKTLEDYYYRPPWELYDLTSDSHELHNLATDPQYLRVFKTLKSSLFAWQNVTNDPWRCAPYGVLQDSGAFKAKPQCFSMHNGLS